MSDFRLENWKVSKIAVVGPGIVGMPMAALLADARICIGTRTHAKVVVVQRNSTTSGWKVGAINAGRSVIGGIEPDLDRIVGETVRDGLLSASHDYAALGDADVILVCIQTDKKEFGPDYGPMFAGLHGIARALQNRPAGKVPLIIFESTLAPSSMMTLIKDHFLQYNLKEGRDILLGNSPNRVMPGRLVERVADSDKLIGGLSPVTPRLIERLYRRIVTKGKLHLTNSLTAEIVKTLENAYRDVRIAYTTEIVRYCDEHDIDFYLLRDRVNRLLSQEDLATSDPNAVPSGGLLIPTIGVGGHCLPKDGILLMWRMFERRGTENLSSLILESRKINDESPEETIRLTEKQFGSLTGKTVALMGTAYRFNSEDTRNSPTLTLAQLLLARDCRVIMHDPYVKPDDQKLKLFKLQDYFTRDARKALEEAEVAIFCTAHRDYLKERSALLRMAQRLKGIFDGCNLFNAADFNGIPYEGIGRGNQPPSEEFINFVHTGFRIMERGAANELNAFIEFANQEYAPDDFNKAVFGEVQRIAGTCVTGCAIVDHGAVEELPQYHGFIPRLVQCARQGWVKHNG
jgi:UDP-N-acetyl-D-mannosaminuronic acid dehydrogenase